MYRALHAVSIAWAQSAGPRAMAQSPTWPLQQDRIATSTRAPQTPPSAPGMIYTVVKRTQFMSLP